jgi:hypothetical protein
MSTRATRGRLNGKTAINFCGRSRQVASSERVDRVIADQTRRYADMALDLEASDINPVRDFPADESDPGAQLKHLISRQAEAVAQMRGSMPVFFAGDGFPCEVIVKRRKWSRQLEEQWASVVGACMNLGYLDTGDTLITTRLILGMIISAAQQSPPAEQLSAEQITHGVVTLLRLEPGSGRFE